MNLGIIGGGKVGGALGVCAARVGFNVAFTGFGRESPLALAVG
jgi:prephenate dehydrogenase